MKILDEQGLQYLWKQISLEDYPNNETLIAILNAIDETKADKEHSHEIEDVTGFQEYEFITVADIDEICGATLNI